MKWLIGCLLALAMVSAAFAGEDPYIAIVGNDADFNEFYFSPKYEQFLFDQDLFAVPTCIDGGTFPAKTSFTRFGAAGCEMFRSNRPANQPEVCDTLGETIGVGAWIYSGLPNARITAGNQGWFEWYVFLPKKPSGEINLCIQCGILKPNAFEFEEFDSVEKCAAETGERIGAGLCVRAAFDANGLPFTDPIIETALPKITAIAYPGPYSPTQFTPFYLTAYRNPSDYTIPATGALPGSGTSVSTQPLIGDLYSRVLLKSCMDKCIIVKLPVDGQVNGAPATTGLSTTEHSLEDGDIIYVRMDVPINNTVDVYCHRQSLRVQGIGEGPF